MKTTLNEIRNSESRPCKDSWEELLISLDKTSADDEPIEMSYILDTLGIDNTRWVLCMSKGRGDISIAHAANCAERVLHIFEDAYPDDKRPRLAIEAARNPDMSKKGERSAITTDAYDASDAVPNGAYSVYAAVAAAHVAYAAETPYACVISYTARAVASAVVASVDHNGEVEWQTENLRQLMDAG